MKTKVFLSYWKGLIFTYDIWYKSDDLLPEIQRRDVGDIWFQQDGATNHIARQTMNMSKNYFDKHLLDRWIGRLDPVISHFWIIFSGVMWKLKSTRIPQLRLMPWKQTLLPYWPDSNRKIYIVYTSCEARLRRASSWPIS